MMQNVPGDLTTTVEQADRNLLLRLLQNAQVSVGHMRGRLIAVPGYDGQITFSNFFARVEGVYQERVKPMQERHEKYLKDSKSNIDIMPIKGPKGNLLNLAILPITGTAKMIGDAYYQATTPFPEVSEDEDETFTSIIDWRKEIDAEFNRLVDQSQDKLDKQVAKYCCTGAIIKCWDTYLNTKGACQNKHTDDEAILTFMRENRINRAKQPQVTKEELVNAAWEVGGNLLDSYLKHRQSAAK